MRQNQLQISDLLGRIGQELSSAAAIVKGLQSSLGPVLERSGELHPALIQEVQSLDHLEQVLSSLSGLMAQLPLDATTPDQDALHGLLDRLNLAALAQRLRGGAHEAVPAFASTGEVDLF